ncbi:MAG: putative DNA binding domain-containing protein [Flavobacteriales bacterium]|nr:putative DNA binding domain-containing protein [Flavobacteriales bacterium]
MSRTEEFLRAHPISESCSDEEVGALANICSPKKYGENETVFCEQQPGRFFFILIKGKITLRFSSTSMTAVFPLQVFGDWAMLNETVRLATATTNVPSEMIAVDYRKMRDPRIFPPEVALKIVSALAKTIIGRMQSVAQTASKILIQKGENQNVEFKSTLRTNLHTGKKDPRMEFAVLKTTAGFLNSDGGVLFIGVADDNSRLGSNANQYVEVNFISVDAKTVLRLDCSSSPEPVYLKEKNEVFFFVRQNAQTAPLNIEQAVNYIRTHF